MPEVEFDDSKLGERLRNARSGARLTQDKAAAHIGISRTTLVAIERGERRVRPHELTSLADLYGTTVSRLVSPNAVSAEVQVHFRATSSSDDDRQLTLDLLLRLATGYVELERAMQSPLRPRVVLQEYPATGGSLEYAADAAMQVRAILGLGMAPVSDLLAIAELQLGLRVFYRAIDSRVSGAYLYHEELGGCILVNSKHPRLRRVWTLAHEIGHYVGERRQSEVALCDDSSDDFFADAFAGALLMPPAALRQTFREIALRGAKFSPRDLILLAHEYAVSVEAMCRWLERLRLLPGQTYDSLRDRGFNSASVAEVIGDPPPDRCEPVPARLLMLAAEGYHKGLLSEGKLSNLLGLDRVQVRELVDDFPGETFDEIR